MEVAASVLRLAVVLIAVICVIIVRARFALAGSAVNCAKYSIGDMEGGCH